ncbi:MAG: hypothetical protein IPN46_18445 [Saprospiraceae bacterium]|nr:hypothetical protein [Saprospiraceae bacterium]
MKHRRTTNLMMINLIKKNIHKIKLLKKMENQENEIKEQPTLMGGLKRYRICAIIILGVSLLFL